MKLSIVTVTLNNLSGLRRTAKSVSSQVWHDYEWIVIDGGSCDGTVEFISSLHRRPNWWVSEPDNGVYHAMNKGVRKANGEYVIFLNAGDTFHSERTLADVFTHQLLADVSYGDWVRVHARHDEFCKAPDPLLPYYFFWGNICQQAMFVKTSLLKDSGFDESYRVVGDWSKWRHLMLEGCSFLYIPVIVCDFEADSGLSERHDAFADAESKKLLDEFPIGLTIQGDLMRQYVDDLESVRRMRKWRLVRTAICIEKKIRAWRGQGIRRTVKNFWITLKNCCLQKGEL